MTAEQARIRQLEDEITKRDNTILLQQNSIKDLQRQVDNLTEIILQMRHDKFGPSSEKTVREDESDGKQLSIFNECIWRRPTAGFAEQNGRDALANGRDA